MTWITAITETMSDAHVFNVRIAKHQHLAYIQAITCCTQNMIWMYKTYFIELLPILVQVFLTVTALTCAEVNIRVRKVLYHMLFSTKYHPKVCTFCDHGEYCNPTMCMCKYTVKDIGKTIIRYIAHYNNLKIHKIHKIWAVWEIDGDMAAWLPRKMVVDVIKLLGGNCYDNRDFICVNST